MNPTKYGFLIIMVVVVWAGVLPLPPVAALSATSSADARLWLDWQVGTRRGRPVIQGYVYNDYGRPAVDVRLLVETLDASGAVTARTIGFVRGVVPFHDRTYFEVPLKTAGVSYRVSLTTFDWRRD
jgi:hypothetical protein